MVEFRSYNALLDASKKKHLESPTNTTLRDDYQAKSERLDTINLELHNIIQTTAETLEQSFREQAVNVFDELLKNYSPSTSQPVMDRLQALEENMQQGQAQLATQARTLQEEREISRKDMTGDQAKFLRDLCDGQNKILQEISECQVYASQMKETIETLRAELARLDLRGQLLSHNVGTMVQTARDSRNEQDEAMSHQLATFNDMYRQEFQLFKELNVQALNGVKNDCEKKDTRHDELVKRLNALEKGLLNRIPSDDNQHRILSIVTGPGQTSRTMTATEVDANPLGATPRSPTVSPPPESPANARKHSLDSLPVSPIATLTASAPDDRSRSRPSTNRTLQPLARPSSSRAPEHTSDTAATAHQIMNTDVRSRHRVMDVVDFHSTDTVTTYGHAFNFVVRRAAGSTRFESAVLDTLAKSSRFPGLLMDALTSEGSLPSMDQVIQTASQRVNTIEGQVQQLLEQVRRGNDMARPPKRRRSNVVEPINPSPQNDT